ncbi:MAG: hypothetical protein ACRYHA_33075 [Janthinobacterium lividum]
MNRSPGTRTDDADIPLTTLSPTMKAITSSILLSMSLFSGCATYHVHQARSADSKLIGSNIVDLIQAVGIPDKTIKVVNDGGDSDRMIAQWNFANSDAALDMTVILLELKIGGAGKCSMTATIDRWGGRVEAVNFPQAHSDSFGSNYSACEPLVDEALKHLPHTKVDARYDAFNLVGAAK